MRNKAVARVIVIFLIAAMLMSSLISVFYYLF